MTQSRAFWRNAGDASSSGQDRRARTKSVNSSKAGNQPCTRYTSRSWWVMMNTSRGTQAHASIRGRKVHPVAWTGWMHSAEKNLAKTNCCSFAPYGKPSTVRSKGLRSRLSQRTNAATIVRPCPTIPSQRDHDYGQEKISVPRLPRRTIVAREGKAQYHHMDHTFAMRYRPW